MPIISINSKSEHWLISLLSNLIESTCTELFLLYSIKLFFLSVCATLYCAMENNTMDISENIADNSTLGKCLFN